MPPPLPPLVRSHLAMVAVGATWAAARWAPETLRRLVPDGAILVGAYLALPAHVILRASAIQPYH